MGSSVRFELILLFNYGYTPKDLMAKGYKETTVYKYSRHYKKAKEQATKIIKGEME